jgi:hypothetical protein
VESSCELGNEPSGSIKYWALSSGCTTCGLSSGNHLHRVSYLYMWQVSILPPQSMESCYNCIDSRNIFMNIPFSASIRTRSHYCTDEIRSERPKFDPWYGRIFSIASVPTFGPNPASHPCDTEAFCTGLKGPDREACRCHHISSSVNVSKCIVVLPATRTFNVLVIN